jgi:DNA polymerase-4
MINRAILSLCLFVLFPVSAELNAQTDSNVKRETRINPVFLITYDPSVISYEPFPAVYAKVCAKTLAGERNRTVGDLRAFELHTLEVQFGRYGARLYELARGIDQSPVTPDRPTKSISAEDTFEQDIPLSQTEDLIRRLAERVWLASRRESRIARTVVLKLKTKEFNIHTHSYTPPAPPTSCEELAAIALSLRERVDLGPERLFRLVGVGLGNFQESPEAVRSFPLEETVRQST